MMQLWESSGKLGCRLHGVISRDELRKGIRIRYLHVGEYRTSKLFKVFHGLLRNIPSHIYYKST